MGEWCSFLATLDVWILTLAPGRVMTNRGLWLFFWLLTLAPGRVSVLSFNGSNVVFITHPWASDIVRELSSVALITRPWASDIVHAFISMTLLNILVPILIRYSTYLSFFGVQLTKQDLQVRCNSPRGPVSYLLVGKCRWHLVQYIADSIVLLYRADVRSVCRVRLGNRWAHRKTWAVSSRSCGGLVEEEISQAFSVWLRLEYE